MGKLLIAPIGHPRNYREALYEVEGVDGRHRSKTSFSALRALLGIDAVVVVAPLTIAPTIEKNPCGGYRAAAREVENLVKDALGGEVDGVEVWVAPNVYGRVRGDFGLYFNYIFHNLLRRLEEKRPHEVYVDLTHGINYMPLLAREAAELAVWLHALEAGNVKLYIYNSDPYPQGHQGPPPTLAIHPIYFDTVDPKAAVAGILAAARPTIWGPQHNLKSPRRPMRDVVEGLGREGCGNLAEDAARLHKALAGGLYLYIWHQAPQVERCLQAFQQLYAPLDAADPQIPLHCKPSGDGQGGDATYGLALPQEVAYLYALYRAAHAVARWLEQRGAKEEGGWRWVPATALEEAAKRYGGDVVEALASKELHDLRSAVERAPLQTLQTPTLYQELLTAAQTRPDKAAGDCQKPSEDLGRPCGADQRTLYAHAGLQKNSTYVKVGEEIYLSYCGCLDEVGRQLGS